jgi:ribosomal protein S12 methylthiotransferase accessory factor
VLDLSADLEIPVFGAVGLHRDDPAADPLLGFGAHFDARIALARAVNELGQSFWLSRVFAVNAYARRFQGRALSEMSFLQPLTTAPPKTAADFCRPASNDFLADIQRCVDLFGRAGLETLVMDQSPPDAVLSVARAIVPGLRHFWPRMAPGRLYDVPVDMGWLAKPRAEDDMNPVPFYF